MTRRIMARRIAALEAKRAHDAMPFVLEDGRTVHVPIDAVLAVFTEAGHILYPDPDAPPYDGPYSEHLELLARAAATPDDSLLAASVVDLARRAREARLGDDARGGV